MANRAFLCCSRFARRNPSQARGFAPERDTVAASTNSLPLLWLALFSPKDLRGAPLTTRTAALRRLPRSVARLERLLPKLGSLTEPARMLASSLTGRFVTIELDELIDLAPDTFEQRLGLALQVLDGARHSDPRRVLAAVSKVSSAKPGSLMGSSHVREVPWERIRAVKERVTPEAALERALASGDVKAAKAIISSGVDLNVRRRGAQSPMQHVIQGTVPCSFARTLVDAGFDLEQRYQGYAALHQAIWHDAVEVVRALISLGADVRARDGFGRPALVLAAVAGATRTTELLLATGLVDADLERAVREAEAQLAKKPQPQFRATLAALQKGSVR